MHVTHKQWWTILWSSNKATELRGAFYNHADGHIGGLGQIKTGQAKRLGALEVLQLSMNNSDSYLQ